MPPAARVGDPHICPMCPAPSPIMPPGCPTVMVGYLPAARMGDPIVCAGPPDVIAMGSTSVMIGYQPAARMGDPTAKGGSIILGCMTVMIGG